jgi:enterochelin esterase-like enzyme
MCHQAGITSSDKVLFPDRGEDHFFIVHLPPCYGEYSESVFPVLYWANGYGQFGYDTADRLINRGAVPPFIIVELQIDPVKGAGADAEIIKYVVPYIDSHYRTQADPQHRSITGISNGAAIAIRTAFQPPYLFGRVAVISGGIADGEQEKFTNWVKTMSPDQRPAVLIDVGDQDGIILLTNYLIGLLFNLNYPYVFSHAPGNHNGAFWDGRMEYYLEWLMPAR